MNVLYLFIDVNKMLEKFVLKIFKFCSQPMIEIFLNFCLNTCEMCFLEVLIFQLHSQKVDIFVKMLGRCYLFSIYCNNNKNLSNFEMPIDPDFGVFDFFCTRFCKCIDLFKKLFETIFWTLIWCRSNCSISFVYFSVKQQSLVFYRSFRNIT